MKIIINKNLLLKNKIRVNDSNRKKIEKYRIIILILRTPNNEILD